jgi:hypothetical protein
MIIFLVIFSDKFKAVITDLFLTLSHSLPKVAPIQTHAGINLQLGRLSEIYHI